MKRKRIYTNVKPMLVRNLICTKCKSQNTISLAYEGKYVLWCSCGRVEIADEATKPKGVYDFRTHTRKHK